MECIFPDVNESNPFPWASASGSSSNPGPSNHTPATMVAGVHWSGHVCCLTWCILEEAEVAELVATERAGINSFCVLHYSRNVHLMWVKF